ncbi:2-polyprenyl-6-methoxyphenol hydroxylase [Flavobacterium aquidurense]|uniref:Flavin-dependent monooxygenase n=1 Tax=Flavobacterium frigidimaris TaxID=262320 RepID=A0ABX4BU24_FLAFR|nr:FAD-dependent monooxygenase [Flavobacterium frigidimaris]OXA81297.1 2-polyprenyl-6-methoxyphenol hydroxylase [Flavobacterium frigidimaris]SDZ00593.1 2-polyprenyl-6-methoxyphenol hydroxylase [Flavobacterium aquidurense]
METKNKINLLQNKKIAIIGGGPGGLTLARLLQRRGLEVKVYERDENRNVRLQGATLDLHFESGLKALESAGLMEVFKENYRPDNDRYRIVDKNGVLFIDDHDKESTGAFGDEAFRPEIDRGPLRDILLDSLQPDTVVWDSHIVSLENKDDQWEIIFKNGKTAKADLVIGADGANSKIRPVVTPIKPVYSGVIYLVSNILEAEKNTPKLYEFVKGGKILAMDDSKTLFLSEKGDGSLDVYIGFKASDKWALESGIDLKNVKEVADWFKKEFIGWDNSWLELFEPEETEFVDRPLYGMPLDQSWETQNNITLLGDAAHLLPPNGEGVNSAMLDALILSENLTSGEFKELKSALVDYEKQMFARFAEEGKETGVMMEQMYSPDGLKIMIELFNELPN